MLKKLIFLVILTISYPLFSPAIYSVTPSTIRQEIREQVREQAREIVASPTPSPAVTQGMPNLKPPPALKVPLPIRNPDMAQLEGTISAISGSFLTVGNVTVNVSSATTFLRKFGAKSSLEEFSVGDEVQVLGKWADDSKTTVNARVIRNLSLQKRWGVFLGTVTATFPNSFTLSTLSRGIQTIKVSNATKYLNRKNQPITLADIATGHKVMVKGLWDNKLNTITAVTLVKDFSLPTDTPSLPLPPEQPRILD